MGSLKQCSNCCHQCLKKITKTNNFKYIIALIAVLIVSYSHPVSAQSTTPSSAFSSVAPEVKVDRCSPNRTEKPRRCEDGIILRHWAPALVDEISLPDRIGRTFIYFVVLIYLFLGVSIVADRFMASIEVITSKEKEIIIKRPNGEQTTTTVRIWNETVSNLTLMALGSSAPEIMLSVIEICGKGFHAGQLGPSTIVGSASFNLFIIIAICVYVIPDGEVRKIKHPRVFVITALWSILAYVWLYVILAVSSPGVVEVWEGVITFFFFPVLVVLAWIADRRLLVYKYMYKRYRAKKKMIVETEGGPESNRMEDGEELRALSKSGSNAGTLSRSIDTLEGKVSLIIEDEDADLAEVENQKKEMVRLLRQLKKKHPDADMQELARMANIEALNHQQKSRAFYRIQATRKMTGAGNILKVKADKAKKDTGSLSNILEGTDTDHITKISFDPPEYKVMENCGQVELQVVRRGGDLNSTIYVDYRTEDGTANAGSDYEFTEGSLAFHSGETIAVIHVPIIDDDIFEEDEYFRVKLRNVRVGTSDGMFESAQRSNRQARLEPPAVATVIILDDDHAGVFSFADESVTISESVGILKIPVRRDAGARGNIVIPYKTVPWTANGGGEDYIDAFGELEFQNDETIKEISIQVIDDEEYEKNKSFFLELGEPRLVHSSSSDSELQEPYIPMEDVQKGNDTGSDSGINGPGEDDKQNLIADGEEEEDEAKRIAELGKPRLGEYSKIEIMIEESYEFKNTVDKLIRKANLAVIVGTSSWREQFIEALSVKGGDDDDEEEASEEPSGMDYVMHYLTVFWKLIFAFIPPTEYFGGWACFVASIIGIGLLTAVIGDVATHFGCTIKLNDAVTAVTFVAMGTSVPDTFASKVAAVGDQYADASIGNVTGSNAVNVFLGIGIAWTLAAVYWAIVGETPEEKLFKVNPGNLAFTVTVFSSFALVAIAVLMVRRYTKSIGAELGGPHRAKVITAVIFVSLWVLYILLAALDSYCVIRTF